MVGSFTTRRTFIGDLASAVGLLCVGGACRDKLEDEEEIAQLDDLDLTTNIKGIYSIEIPPELPSLSPELNREALSGDDSLIVRDIALGTGKEFQTKIRLSEYVALRSRNHRIKEVLGYAPFLTPHPIIDDLAQVLTQNSTSPEQAAQRILNFIHHGIVYDVSIESYGVDYVRHPLETLVEGNGDCEDTTILGAALSRARDLDVILVVFPPPPESITGHIGYAVAGDFHGAYFEVNGKKYFYAETTGTYWLTKPSLWKIGDIHSTMKNKAVDIYTLHDAPPSNPVYNSIISSHFCRI